MVGGRDRSGLVDGVLKQVGVVRGLVGAGVAVRGVLCFIEADWPLIDGSFVTRDVDVLWPRRLYPLLQDSGPLPVAEIATIHHDLACALRSAG